MQTEPPGEDAVLVGGLGDLGLLVAAVLVEDGGVAGL